jgi:hypothetical protein
MQDKNPLVGPAYLGHCAIRLPLAQIAIRLQRPQRNITPRPYSKRQIYRLIGQASSAGYTAETAFNRVCFSKDRRVSAIVALLL